MKGGTNVPMYKLQQKSVREYARLLRVREICPNGYLRKMHQRTLRYGNGGRNSLHYTKETKSSTYKHRTPMRLLSIQAEKGRQ